jgi:MarR family transcriptional regulator for hemolysin
VAAPEDVSAHDTGDTPCNTSDHELDAPPWRRVESTLMATARVIRRAYEIRLADLDLNLSQASLLAFLFEAGPITQSRLASRLGMGRAAAGLVIDALEKRGLIERQKDPDDRRAWLIALRPDGIRVTEPIFEIDATLRSELRAGISHTERQQLAGLLLRLQTNLANVLAKSD